MTTHDGRPPVPAASTTASLSPGREAPAAGGERPPGRAALARAVARRLAIEVLVLGSLFMVYRYGRTLAGDHVSDALKNAESVWAFEQSWNFLSELHLQRLVLDNVNVVKGLNGYYVAMHFPITIAWLIWACLKRPDVYARVRWAFVVPTFAALVIHLVFPLAPPRMLAHHGFVDTMRVFGPSAYGPPRPDEVANQFAAMPSLHFGWAVLVAVGVITLTRWRWRWLALLHPVITLGVIVATGNHFWVDAVVAALLVAVTGLVDRLLFRHGDTSRATGSPAPPSTQHAAH